MTTLNLAIKNKDYELAKSLIAAGTDVNGLDETGRAPLILACFKHDPVMVQLLLEHGADPNIIPNGENDSALMRGAREGDVEIVKLLLAKGANLNHVDEHTYSALHVAVSDRSKRHLQIMKMLIEAGADVNLGELVTPLMKACDEGSVEMVEALLKAGANINAETSSGTPLVRAIEGERPDMVKLLLKAGADINAVTQTGTALTSAIKEERLDMVKLLLSHGADINFVDEDMDESVFDVAKEVGNKKIIALLKKAKTSPMTAPEPEVMPDFAELLTRFKAAAKKSGLSKTMAKAATPAAIIALEKRTDCTLPAEVRSFYEIHNGQKTTDEEAFVSSAIASEEFWLIPCKEALAEWEALKENYDAGEFESESAGPDPGIQDCWWHPKWIPIASNGGGDFLCIDFHPADGGMSGQIIAFYHEESKRELLFRSFAELLWAIVRDLD